MVSILDIQSIPFDLKHLWVVKILSPELPAKTEAKGNDGNLFSVPIFPITGYSDTIFSVESKIIDTPSGSVSIPYKNNVGNLPFTLTFYDIVGGVFVQYFENIVKLMFPSNTNGTFANMSLLSTVKMKAEVSKLNYDRTPIHTKTIYMYPDGELQDIGESEAGLHIYTLNFKKVG